MIVVSMTKCPPKLRGDLSKWLLEINTGVYVGHVSARVRDALWKRICENIADGQATMVFNAQNEQHMDFYVHNSEWKPVDFDGIMLMKHPEKGGYFPDSEMKDGFSNAAKRRMAKKRRKKEPLSSYVILDIETTGLSAENDDIIEIAVAEVENGKAVNQHEWLIKTDKHISSEIQKLTGINNEMLEENGADIEYVLPEVFGIIEGRNVIIYNAAFDIGFLENQSDKMNIEFPSIQIHDVLALAKNQIKGLANYRLDTVASYLGIEIKKRHRAGDDCLLLNDAFIKLNEI